MTSWGLWVALLWIVIVGSKPVSLWFGGGIQIVNPGDYLEGSPLDRGVFFLLIAMGLMVLIGRRVSWGSTVASNRWLFAFFLYCGISVIWSDFFFVSFKRWIKDCGNVVMVLIILTEEDPAQAMKAVFARYTYFAVPLSVLFIKYFPELGRYYDMWTWEPAYSGVTTEKNALGCIALVCGLFLVWDLMEARAGRDRETSKTDLGARVALLVMVAWLLHKAGSMTALICLLVGTGILLFMHLPAGRRQIRHLGTYSLAAGALTVFVYSFPEMLEAFTGLLGRNMTLTGRTDLWAELLGEPVNAMLGTGYQSFWLGARAAHYWEMFSFHPNQAHNGYLEVYLNVGLAGLGLLLATIVSAGRRLKKELVLGSGVGMLRFSLLVVGVVYNWTEAMVNNLSLVWIVLLMAALKCPRRLHVHG